MKKGDYVQAKDGLAKGMITKVIKRNHGLQYIVCGGYYFESELETITKEETFNLDYLKFNDMILSEKDGQN